MTKAGGGAGQLRIIGGRWRGRRLTVLRQDGLRPTSDRIRETLFNWLGARVEGARCLDGFAGSGALGFEAASRGAGEVVLIEQQAAAARALTLHSRLLGATQVSVQAADLLRWLRSAPPRPFDICFLDPPFQSGLLTATLATLRGGAAQGWLAPGALVYLESDRRTAMPELPAGWTWLRQKRAGNVCYGLAEAGHRSPLHAEVDD